MIILRSVTQLIKPLTPPTRQRLSPLVQCFSTFLETPKRRRMCRTITTGIDQVRFWNGIKKSAVDPAVLDPYLGSWEEIPEAVQGFEDFMKALGVPKSRWDDARHVHFMRFSRDNNNFQSEFGIIGEPPFVHNFQLDRFFITGGFGGVMKVKYFVIPPNRLASSMENVEQKDMVFNTTSEVSGNTLLWETEIKKATIKRKYRKVQGK